MYAWAIFDSDFSVRLTVALLHFLWQGFAVALLVWVVNGCLKRAASHARYVANLAALGVIAACLPVTFITSGAAPVGRSVEVAAVGDARGADDDGVGHEVFTGGALHRLPAAGALPVGTLPLVSDREPAESELPWVAPRSNLPPATQHSSLFAWIHTTAPYATTAYLLGVIAMLIRLAMALWGGQRLRSVSQPVTDETLRGVIQRVARRVGLKTAPAVAWCQRVSVPVVVGVAKPLILLPASLASGLLPDQIESLLTHELAHIRRHDLWVNLLQRLIEAVFFFHPAVWYVSRRVSTERENCCDDFVLSAGWPRVQYADALVRMAELCLAMRGPQPAPHATLLAASGESPSQFKRRVLRLLGQEPSPALVLNRTGVVGLVVAVAALLAAPLVVRTLAGAAPAEAEGAAYDAPFAATAPPNDAWPQWGGSALRNHASPVTGLPETWDVAKKLNVKWIAQLGTATYGSPIVAGDKVLIGTNNAAGRVARFPKTVDLSCLQCFDKETGRFLWQYSSEKLPSGRVNDWPGIGLCGSPSVEGDRLWLMTNRCEVVCLDLRGFRDGENDGPFDGEASKADDEADVVWRIDLMKELGVRPFCQAASSPTLAGELVLLNTSNGVDESHDKIPAPHAPSFVALNRRTGRVVWSDASPGGNILPTCPSSSPAVAELGGVWQAIFCGGDGWLYSFDLGDMRQGKTTLLWKFDCNPKTSRWQLGGKGNRNTLIASPVIYDGRVYVAVGRSPEDGEGTGHLWCIDPTKRGDISPELVFNRADPTKTIAHKRWQACDEAAGDFTRANANSGAVWHYESFDQNGDGRHDFAETMHRAIGSVSLADGLALIADLAGILHCLDARTGRPYWTHDLAAAVWSTPLVADGRIYVADEDGDVAVFRLAKKKALLAEFNVEGAVYGSFAAADGSLFLATTNKLLAIAQPAPDTRGGADWPLFRRSPDARGTASDGLSEKPELLWKTICSVARGSADGGGGEIAERESFEATAAIYGGAVFLGGREGTLFALDVTTGAEKWRFKNAGGFLAPASVRGGLLYLGDSDGKFHCLDAGTGALKWTFAAEGPIDNGANFFKDRVIFGSQDASLYCLDAATGKLVWKRTLGDQVRCFPTIGAGRIFVAGCDGKLHVLEADTGTPVGEVALDGATGCTPAVLGERLFVGTDGGSFFGIDWREAKIAWTYQQPGRAAGYRSSAAATDDVVVVGSRSKAVAGLNPKTGEPLWTFNTASPIDGSPTIAHGRAYFGTSRGRLHALDIKTGKPVWEYAAGGGFQSSPAVAGGRLVIASEDGVVYCFGAKAPAEESKKDSPVDAGGNEADKSAGKKPSGLDNSIRLAVKYIESQQTAAGDWGKLMPGFDDGRAALCTLALVRAGRQPDEASVKRALEHLVPLDNSRTYTVALQTVLLAAVDAKKHRERIAWNAKWLADVQTTEGDARGGWSYGPKRDLRSDGSNSRFAAWALDAARRAGVAVPEATWRMAAEYWLKLQGNDGSWGYQALAGGTPTMTTSGIASLTFVRAAVADEGLRRRIDVAIDRAWKWHDAKLGIGDLFGAGVFPHYYLESLSTAATMTGHFKVRGGAWRPEVARRLVAAQDATTGAWSNKAEAPLIATSWAVLFLTQDGVEKRDRKDLPAAKPEGGGPTARGGGAPAATDGLRVVDSLDERLAKRITLKVTDRPLIFVLDDLEHTYHVPVTLDLRAFKIKGIDPHTRISLDLRDVMVREAFRKVLSPVGLTFEVTATGVRVPPEAKGEAPAKDTPAPPKAAKASADSARIVVKYDIADAEADAKIYVQHINGRGDIGTETVGLMKWNPLKNGGTLDLKDLAAGDYQVARYRQVEIGRVGMSRVHSGLYLDRRQFKLKDGETVTIDFTRPKSRPVKGRVLALKEAKLEQAVVCVCSENAKDDESLGSLDVTLFDARLCDKDGAFQTERLAPGKYAILAQAYEPLTEEALKLSGVFRPRYVGVAKLTVPETGDAPVVEVSLRDTEAKAKPEKKPDRLTSIVFNVLDRTGQKAVPRFRVIPGYRPKEGDREKPVWRRDAARPGKDGQLLWPLADLRDEETAFLIEADGHQSSVWAWIKKADGPKDLFFMLGEVAKGGDDAAMKDAWGDLAIRFLYDGPRPKPARIPVTKDVAAPGPDVADESLLVGDDGGLANVAVYLTSKDVPVHPDERKRGERPVELRVADGLFQPRVLTLQVKQKLTFHNPLTVAITFHLRGVLDDSVNRLVAPKSDDQYQFSRAERSPLPVVCNIHPWMRAYVLPLDHPYAAVSGKDGAARVRNLPVGEWTFRFWHEKAGFLKDADGKREFRLRIDPKGSRAEYRVSPEFAVKLAERRESE